MRILDPHIAQFVARIRAGWAAHPALDTLPMPAARQVAEAVRAPWAAGGPEMARTHEAIVDTAAGPLRLRIHRPHGLADGPAPALLYVHGGGFVTFSIDTHDRLMREYAAAGGFAVVGIDYPLSPEAPYPIALDRIVALVEALRTEGAALGIDPQRLAIGGDSAGGNLSLATALRRRDAGAPMLLRAILANYGAFSPLVSDAAERAHGGAEAMLTQDDMVAYFRHYLPGGVEDPYAVPLTAMRLDRLPPMLLVVAEEDVLAEQSHAIAARLRAAGTTVEVHSYPGATHSFLEAMSIAPLARRAIADSAAWVAARLRD